LTFFKILSQPDSKSGKWFWVFFLASSMAGVFLRLYLISDQVILDDEWHALNFSIHHSVGYLLTHFSYAGANIIPLNAYVRMLLVSLGWSELFLFLPSIVAGIACLLLFPLVLRKKFSDRVAAVFSFLLAISPLIIFYSRACRPYSIYTFLGFLSLWILYAWCLNGGKKFGILYVIAGVLCIYFHFVGIIFVFVPLGCAVIAKLMEKSPRQQLPPIREKILPNLAQFVSAGFAILLILTVLLAAAIIHHLPHMELSPARFSLQSILGFCQILSVRC